MEPRWNILNFLVYGTIAGDGHSCNPTISSGFSNRRNKPRAKSRLGWIKREHTPIDVCSLFIEDAIRYEVLDGRLTELCHHDACHDDSDMSGDMCDIPGARQNLKQSAFGFRAR